MLQMREIGSFSDELSQFNETKAARNRGKNTGEETNARTKENGEIGEADGTSGESGDFGEG